MGTQISPPSIHLAVIGCGPWGSNLAREFAQLGVLAAVVDEVTEHSQNLSRLHGTQSSTWQSVLQDNSINAIALATPAVTHAALSIQALNAGKHVFIEKPLALSVSEGDCIAAATRKSGKIVFVGHLFHYHPAFIKLQALVQEGKLGRVRQIYSFRFALGRIRHYEDALWSLAPHDISMILSLTGVPSPNSVTATGSFHLDRPHIADAVTAHLNFPDDVRAQISVSWLYPEKERKLIVIGERSSVVFDDGKPWDTKLLLTHHKMVGEGDRLEVQKGLTEAVPLIPAEPLANECRCFINCVRHGSVPITGLDEGLSVLRVLHSASEAMHRQDAFLSLSGDPHVTPTKPNAVEGVHDTAVIDSGVKVGEGTRIWHFSHILHGASIGRGCIIGQNVMLDKGVAIGDYCKIQNNVSIYKGVVMEDSVFCGPSCVFTNVLTPRAHIERKSEFSSTIVRRGATLGANATVVCGVELGAYCMVGAGAVVTKNVAPYALVVGNPARQIGWVSAAGERLGTEMICPRSHVRYALKGHELVPVKPSTQTAPNRVEIAPGIPFVDLQTQRLRIQESLDRRIWDVLSGAQFVMGVEVSALETKLSEYTGAAHVIGCASGTDALTLALMALELQRGHAVLVPSFTYVATIEPIVLLGGIPVFLDVEPDSLTLNGTLIDAAIDAASKAGHQVTGIVAVDIFGHPASYDAINSAAREHGLWVIADAAQSIGASVDGKQVGTLAKITTTSFFPSKPLGCYGDGGAVFTDDPELAQILRSLHRHGRGHDKFDSIRVGLNSRLDTLQAAVLLAKLEVFAEELESRQLVASRYKELLTGTAVAPLVPRRGYVSAWASYAIRCQSNRDLLRTRLQEAGIPTAVYYPRPVHTMAPYSGYPLVNGGCPVTDRAAASMLSLPMHPYLDAATQERIVAVIRSAEPGS